MAEAAEGGREERRERKNKVKMRARGWTAEGGILGAGDGTAETAFEGKEEKMKSYL